MTAWMKVWMKEMRLGRKFMYGVLILMAILAAVTIGLGISYPHGVVSLVYGSGTLMILFYLMAYLIVSFSNEKNSYSIWMQTPLPGWSLIAAKVLAGVVSMLITLVAACLLFLAIDVVDGELNISGMLSAELDLIPESELAEIRMVDVLLKDFETYKWHFALALIPAFLCGALIIGAIYLIFYMSNRMLRRRTGRWSGRAAILVTLFAIWLLDKLFESPILDLFDWGSFTLVDLPIMFDGDMILLQTLPVGYVVFSILILGLVVFVSGWLLDRKVEVR